MANKSKVQSVEPDIADLVNGWLKSYGLDYKLEQASLNSEIDKALDEYHSKSGGKGGNRPDAKLLLKDKYGTFYPVLIEYKGYKDKLVKLDTDGIVDNKKDKNEPNYTNIKSYAVNGAIHYANAILHYTSYTRIIAIGVTGYKDEFGKLQHEIGVYYVSADKNNLGFGQRVGDYTDLSFLKPSHFDEFVEKLNELSLTQAEIDKLKEKREKEINISLVKLNNDIYKEETGLGENDRIYLVAATIIATLGAEGVKPLEKSDLESSTESGETDGDKIIRKITSFLKKKQLPQQKQDLIIRTLSNTLVDENRNKPENGESQIKRVFSKIVDDLGIYYKIGITTDFTGMLFNEMYMPIDLFVGKSSVQTNIYVFKVGEPHHAKNTVKFIDFSNDGYTRTNRKKASVNLRDTDHAKERYQEIADIVRFGKSELNIFTDKEYYEGKIDPENGADWNQSAPINTIPTLEDFKKTVSDYLAWEVSTLLKGKSSEDNERLGK